MLGASPFDVELLWQRMYAVRHDLRHPSLSYTPAMSAIETGFKSAFGTIFDSNFTALIAAVVLFGVGSGPVRGFAITHVIGILTTVFTAYTVTRYIVSLWVGWAKPKEVPL